MKLFLKIIVLIFFYVILISKMPHIDSTYSNMELFIRSLCLLFLLIYGVIISFIGITILDIFDKFCEYAYDKNFLGCQNRINKEHYIRYSILAIFLDIMRWTIWIFLISTFAFFFAMILFFRIPI